MKRRSLTALPLTLVILFAAAVPAAASSLFDSMGGEKVLRSAVARFTDLVVADDRINFTFAEADLSKFKELLYQQLCNLSGGPCVYKGRDMRTAHAKLNITTAEFNALAEDLYVALDKAGVPYRQQNRLMALLAPMQHDIVKTSPPATPPPASLAAPIVPAAPAAPMRPAPAGSAPAN